MNFKIVRVNLSGVEEQLARMNKILEALAVQAGAIVDPVPFKIDPEELGASYTDPERQMIEELVAKRKGF